MKKTYLLGVATAALFVVAGCSSSGTGGSSGTSTFTTCTQGSDCPRTEPVCAPLAGQTGNVCQCNTDAACGAGFVCNNIDKQCQQKCTSDANCQGGAQARKCDTATGQCVAGGTTGSTACDADGGAACPSGQVCDTTTHSCKAPSSCGTNQTQGTCPYGQACFTPASGGTTTECEQVAQCASAFQPQTTPNASPVVFDVTKTSTRAATETDSTGAPLCNSGTAAIFTGHFYDPNNAVSSTNAYAEINYVTATKVPGTGNGNTYKNVSIDPTQGTFSFELCTDLSAKAAGVILTNSNGQDSNSACISF